VKAAREGRDAPSWAAPSPGQKNGSSPDSGNSLSSAKLRMSLLAPAGGKRTLGERPGRSAAERLGAGLLRDIRNESGSPSRGLWSDIHRSLEMDSRKCQKSKKKRGHGRRVHAPDDGEEASARR
jgi:hypothetical protein